MADIRALFGGEFWGIQNSFVGQFRTSKNFSTENSSLFIDFTVILQNMHII